MRRNPRREYLTIFRRVERMLQVSMYIWRHKPLEFKSHMLRTQADQIGKIVSAYASMYADTLIRFMNDSGFNHGQISSLFAPRRSELVKECLPWHKLRQGLYEGEYDARQKHRNASVVAAIALVSGLFVGFLCGLLFL